MVGHGGSSAGSYLADPTSPIPSHCASIVVTSTVRVSMHHFDDVASHSYLLLALNISAELTLKVLVTTIDALRHF